MNRSRRAAQKAKPFVSGGVYDPSASVQQPVQQQLLQVKKQEQEEIETVQDDLVNDEFNDGNERPQFKKIFANRKKSSVRAKEKKIRRNRQLRKAILPKNALMALHEVKGIVIGDYVCTSTEGGFIATVTVNGKEYNGKGTSKTSAKNNVSEKALRDYIIDKMIKKPRFPKNSDASNNGNDSMDVIEESLDGENDEDDLPMVNLASFAIFKLFTEWENEGYIIPELHPSARPTGNISENGDEVKPKEPKKAPIRNELPPNWETMHPATLLCMMRPGINYVELDPIGEKPNIIQRLSISADEREFIGSGRSKKIARRNAAVELCNTLFGTNFIKEE